MPDDVVDTPTADLPVKGSDDDYGANIADCTLTGLIHGVANTLGSAYSANMILADTLQQLFSFLNYQTNGSWLFSQPISCSLKCFERKI